ncbi:MAG: hypothetical protein AUH29_17625 [Candidatus Rokubacteria bacterium 13_1_40CM_69_27]|nr:MAG: hypothetical protein AUH29_17625 [Candidatus Rokubacteria bacterium 13_1_40CM_69_27]OLC36971.1 MAG: hypothetical protein AUH81_07360 [Candidatus Rokubacteria bacterium 13_1_40CM_4_69_5]
MRMSAVIDPAPLPDTPSPAANGLDSASRASARALFAGLQGALERMQGLVGTTAAFPWVDVAGLLERVHASLEDSDDLFWLAHSPHLPEDARYLAFHHARVTVLAMRIGARLGYDVRRLLELGLAATVIDIGLCPVRERVLRRAEPPSADEQALFQAHPLRSAEIVQQWSLPLPAVTEMVLQHHEREQGQGYPRGLSVEAIHPDALVLGLVDTYAQMTALPATRPQFRPHEAMREMLKWRHGAFPPPLLKALLSEITVFPPGSKVCLSTGEVGTVVKANRRHPLRPKVAVTARARGFQPTVPRIIDLAEAPFIFISGSSEVS